MKIGLEEFGFIFIKRNLKEEEKQKASLLKYFIGKHTLAIKYNKLYSSER